MMLNFCGLKLKNPFVVASGPVTNTIGKLRKAEKYGAAAVSTKLALYKRFFDGAARYYSEPNFGLIPMFDPRMELKETAELVTQAKNETNLVVFCNITHRGDDISGWVEMGEILEAAGADALELNFVCPNITLSEKQLRGEKTDSYGALLGQDDNFCRRIITALKAKMSIPVLAKLTYQVSDIAEIAMVCKEAGADGITSACGYPSLPPVDIYNHGRICNPFHSGVSIAYLVGSRATLLNGFANVALISKKTNLPIIGGGGIRTWQDGIQMMMWGAKLITACTIVMLEGFEAITRIVRGMEEFLGHRGYASYEGIIGLSLPYLKMVSQIEVVPARAQINQQQCSRCDSCTVLGHCEAITIEEELVTVDSNQCNGCGVCEVICQHGAINMVGKDDVSGYA